MPWDAENSEFIPTAPPPSYDSVNARYNQPVRNPHYPNIADNFADADEPSLHPLLTNDVPPEGSRKNGCEILKSVA